MTTKKKTSTPKVETPKVIPEVTPTVTPEVTPEVKYPTKEEVFEAIFGGKIINGGSTNE